jgi:hypothetical protein
VKGRREAGGRLGAGLHVDDDDDDLVRDNGGEHERHLGEEVEAERDRLNVVAGVAVGRDVVEGERQRLGLERALSSKYAPSLLTGRPRAAA